jgi:hypothetical protein
MAILKGFPPSNTIQLDPPSKWTCEMCGKEFWQSFPLSLHLDISNVINYGILPCRECWSEDQGKGYWVPGPNKWGDEFSVYSKVREGHTLQELEEAYTNYRKKCHEGTWPRIVHVRFDELDFESAYKKINYKITEFWSPFREIRTGSGWRDREHVSEEEVPNKLTLIANGNICKMFYEQEGYNAKLNLFRRDRWGWTIQCNPHMPDMMNAVFVQDPIPNKDVEVCNGLAEIVG